MDRYIIAILILAGCNRASSNNQNNLPEEKEKIRVNQKQIDSIKCIVKEGDIILRGGTDIESNIIRDFSYEDKSFSHCGIILKSGDRLKVTHILGGISNIEGGILNQTMEDFLSYPDNESAGIYKTKLNNIELNRIYYFFDSIKSAGVSFDLKFNLFTKKELYCTEVVIDALSFAKRNSHLFSYTSFNLKNTKYFFLANKGDEFLFYPIDQFQHSKALKQKGLFYFPNYQKR